MALATEAPRRETLQAKWERHYPFVLGLAGGVACLGWGDEFFTTARAQSWSGTTVYFATFDLASIITAFLFTFYAFVVTTERGFIAQMKKSNAYRLFKSYTLQAIALAAALTLVSVPFMVVGPQPTSFGSTLAWVSAWFALVAWAASAFVRSARIFVVFIAHQS